MKQKVIGGSLILVALFLIGILAAGIFGSDDKGPQIEFAKKDLVYSEGDSEEDLLDDVTAYDAKDGDVSSTLVVDNVIILSSNEQAKVFYVAKDNDGNITRCSRIVEYQAGEDKEEEPAEEEDNTKQPQDTTVTETNTTPVNPSAPVVKLTQNAVTLTKGSQFKYASYIESVTDDKDTREVLFRNIHVDGEYNMKQEGAYTISYYVVDSDGNKSNVATLSLTVQ